MDYSILEQKIKYIFNNKELLDQACRHSSYVNEHIEEGLQDNERLEFLGDAVLNLVIGQILMEKFPQLKEGELSRTRANFVNENQLAKIANSINLGDFIKLGKGEILSRGSKKKSILADAFEALIAAIYLDGGFEKAYQVIEDQYSPLLDSISTNGVEHDFKTRLQEFIQMYRLPPPNYTVVQETGPDHDKTFIIELIACGQSFRGIGKNKKAAEQQAAQKACELLFTKKQ